MTTKPEEIATVLTATLAVATAAYGLYLVGVGQEITTWPAVPVGAEPGDPVTRSVPAMQGLIPLLASLGVLAGLAVRRLSIAWIGAVVILAFAVLFVFGVGGALIPVAGALLVALAILTVFRHRPPSRGRPSHAAAGYFVGDGPNRS